MRKKKIVYFLVWLLVISNTIVNAQAGFEYVRNPTNGKLEVFELNEYGMRGAQPTLEYYFDNLSGTIKVNDLGKQKLIKEEKKRKFDDEFQTMVYYTSESSKILRESTSRQLQSNLDFINSQNAQFAENRKYVQAKQRNDAEKFLEKTFSDMRVQAETESNQAEVLLNTVKNFASTFSELKDGWHNCYYISEPKYSSEYQTKYKGTAKYMIYFCLVEVKFNRIAKVLLSGHTKFVNPELNFIFSDIEIEKSSPIQAYKSFCKAGNKIYEMYFVDAIFNTQALEKPSFKVVNISYPNDMGDEVVQITPFNHFAQKEDGVEAFTALKSYDNSNNNQIGVYIRNISSVKDIGIFNSKAMKYVMLWENLELNKSFTVNLKIPSF